MNPSILVIQIWKCPVTYNYYIKIFLDMPSSRTTWFDYLVLTRNIHQMHTIRSAFFPHKTEVNINKNITFVSSFLTSSSYLNEWFLLRVIGMPSP